MAFNKKPLKEKADRMIGKDFTYKGVGYHVTRVELNDVTRKMTVFTDGPRFTKEYEDAEDFLDLWEPLESKAELPAVVDNSKSELQIQLAASFYQDNETADKMLDMLQKTINKVTNDPKYVPQAKVIVNGVNAITNVVKLKIAMRSAYQQKKSA
jgi:hypothetical protein